MKSETTSSVPLPTSPTSASEGTAAIWIMAMVACGMLEYVVAEQASFRAARWIASAVTGCGLFMVTGYWRAALLRPSMAVVESLTSTRHPSLADGWVPGGRSHALFLVAMLLPCLFDPIARRWFGMGATSEMLLLDGLRNVLVVLVGLRGSEFCMRLAATTSLFLVLYLYAACLNRGTMACLAIYGIVGIGWLSGTYWSRVRHRLPVAARSESPRAAAILIAVASVLLLLVTTGFWNVSRAAHVLPGWFSSSGGTQDTDPFAWGGVGDGDQLIRGTERADSFGPVEGSMFLESDQPSLYDMFNDLYDEPKRFDRSRKASIPLSPATSQANRKIRAQTQHAGREFSTVRQATRTKSRSLDDRISTACLYVDGRVPLHLAVEYYDHWDGTHLSQQNATSHPSPYLMNVGAERWLTWAAPFSSELFARESSEQHQLRVVRLGSPRVPLPPQASRLTVEHLHSAHLFKWTEDGALRFVADQLPPLSVLRVASVRTSRERLERATFRMYLSHPRNPRSTKVQEIDPQVITLAKQWSTGATSDWQVVQQVVARIREQAQLDANHRMDETTTDVVRAFLVDDRRGPDYLFAISTAVILQHLGFETRVVSGFYARPDRYDPITRRTAVAPEDLHFWTEVRERRGSWITVDPSPGYEVLYEATSWRSVAWSMVLRCCQRITEFPLVAISLALAIAFYFCERSLIASWIRWLRWYVFFGMHPRRQVVATLRLLETTLSISNEAARGAGTPIGHWLRGLATPKGVRPQQVDAFDRITRWALYATDSESAYPESEIRIVCRGIARWCLHWAWETDQQRWPMWLKRWTRHALSSRWFVREDAFSC